MLYFVFLNLTRN